VRQVPTSNIKGRITDRSKGPCRGSVPEKSEVTGVILKTVKREPPAKSGGPSGAYRHGGAKNRGGVREECQGLRIVVGSKSYEEDPRGQGYPELPRIKSGG